MDLTNEFYKRCENETQTLPVFTFTKYNMGFVLLVVKTGFSKVDVYCRNRGSMECYFVGKACAEPGISAVGAAAVQAPVVKEHTRNLHPSLFGGVSDDAMEILTSPGWLSLLSCF